MLKNFNTVKTIKKASSSEEIFSNWSNLIVSACLFLLYSTLLAYIGFFNIEFILIGLMVILVLNKSYQPIIFFFRTFFQENFDLLRFIMVIFWAVWFLLLVFLAPYPAFSGRDEGSYANAAVYLAKFHSVNFHLPLLQILNGEGLAHQALNFPGFVINNGSLSSQFSPAYFVWLGIFYSITGTVGSFSLANGCLVLGGAIGFYLLTRLFVSRWIAVAGLFALMFNFLFLWFPRFTFSENMAFFLFPNLIYFIYLFRRTQKTAYLYPTIAILALFPLVRPEGWWLIIASLILFGYWYQKKIISISQSKLKQLSLIALAGLIFASSAIYTQFPVYKRLVRDWIKWPATSSNYTDLLHGRVSATNLEKILGALFPSREKFMYFLQVEWNYGILIFGLVAVLLLFLFLFYRKNKLFSDKINSLIGITALLSFPFFGAFFSPQISADHPWMLRRFLFVVLPCGILATLILLLLLAKRIGRKVKAPLISLILALLIFPSIFASAYFVMYKTDSGRREILAKIAQSYSPESYLFLARESNGDGWRMWSEPLSSVYNKNSAYIYSPQNLIDNRQFILDRFSEGKKSYVVLSDNAFDFEHELGKAFNLVLDKEFTFSNVQYRIQNAAYNPGFPLLERQDYTTKVYLLTPK